MQWKIDVLRKLVIEKLAPLASSVDKLVLGENQQSIDAVGAILSSSSCGNDSFLLAILSMTVLKILERYDAAAKATPEQAKFMVTHPDNVKVEVIFNDEEVAKYWSKWEEEWQKFMLS